MPSLAVHRATTAEDTLLKQQRHSDTPVYGIQKGVSKIGTHELVYMQVYRVLGIGDPLYEVVERRVGAD